MSADNYIIVLKTPTPDGYEYRVEHVLGRYWEEMIGQPKDGHWSNERQGYEDVTQYFQTLQEVIEQAFKDCKVYTNEGEALVAAHQLEKDQYIVEYGVSVEEYDWQFGGGAEDEVQ